MAFAVGLGRLADGTLRATLYGVAAGTAFGLLAALTKASTHLLGEGAATFFTAWQPYGMAVIAIAGAIVQQSAFQAGPLPASLPVMDAVEPTIAVCIGVFAFNEHVGSSPLALAVEAAGVIALLTGIVVLDRSPLIAEMQSSDVDGHPARRVRSSSAKSGNRDTTVSSGNSS
jgi:hypothetical protein